MARDPSDEFKLQMDPVNLDRDPREQAAHRRTGRLPAEPAKGNYAQQLQRLSEWEWEWEWETEWEWEAEWEWEWETDTATTTASGPDRAIRGVVQAMDEAWFPKGDGRLVHKASIARSNLRWMLEGAAVAGMAAMQSHAGAARALEALPGLEFKVPHDPSDRLRQWEHYVGLARDAFEQLGRMFSTEAAGPGGAARLAGNAYEAALQHAAQRRREQPAPPADGPVTISVRPGQSIVIVCK